jgi:integrase
LIDVAHGDKCLLAETSVAETLPRMSLLCGILAVMENAQPETTEPGTGLIPANSLHRRLTEVILPADEVAGAGVESLTVWIEAYQALAIVGVRSDAVAKKIALQLGRFARFFEGQYGHERIGACLKRDVVGWQAALVADDLAPATVNNHLAALSAFTTWVSTHAPSVFPLGDPAKGVSEMGLPPLEPRALSEAQVRSLKNVCDRLPKLYEKRGRRWAGKSGEPHAHRRPWRDRAMVFVLLSTGLRREELVRLDLSQVEPWSAEGLRKARKGQISGVRGKGKTQRTVFLSADARVAVADYLENERGRDAADGAGALFLTAKGLSARKVDGRMGVQAINLVLSQIGRLHDAEVADPTRRVSPLRPHDLRHTFAFSLARETNADPYELERRLGHRSQKYIQRYTNPPEEVAAGYVERL